MPKTAMNRLKPLVFALLVLVLIVSTISCITIKVKPKGEDSTSAAATSAGAKTRPHPPVRMGEITTGTKVEVASQTVSASGGTIAVNKPGDALDGFVISVPPASFSDSRTFKVSSAPITKQSFGSDINPVSPLITVENGGGYSGKIMYVRIPVKVPDGNFAMGFIFDEKTKQLEGLPLVAADSESITISTRHFSSFFISMIEKALLSKDTDSGFKPGIDDWQFVNYGSYIATEGHCEGQSMAAMWYYCTQPDGKDLCLYGRYDNNGNKPETPALWEDDSYGYRFASVLQAENKDAFSDAFWTNLQGKQWQLINNKWELKDVPGIGDGGTFNLFSYSIRATGEPQEVGIYSKAGGGHSMVVYKAVGNALYVADPNYPGSDDRKIIYYSGEGKFKPYNSGANKKEIDAGNGTAYETIHYLGKSTLLPWDKIAPRWTEFKNGTIGNDKFPQYEIVYQNEKNDWVTLPAGYNSKNKKISLGVKRLTGADPLANTFYRDGVILQTNEIDLKPGANEVGVYVTSKDLYVDFKYVNVIYQPEETPAPAVNVPIPYVAAVAKLDLGPVFGAWLKGQSYYFTDLANHEVPITWNGLNFSGSYTGKPSAGAGTGTMVCQISGTLASAPKPDRKPVNLTLTYKANWDTTNVVWHNVGSYEYKVVNLPVYIVAMTNQEGHWRLDAWPGEEKGAAVQKYLNNVSIKFSETFVGDPRRRADYHPDWSYTYNNPACGPASGDLRGTELFINIRSPLNWQTKTDNR